jgi:hypothetical protein
MHSHLHVSMSHVESRFSCAASSNLSHKLLKQQKGLKRETGAGDPCGWTSTR